jgi:hypothetical protein
LAAQPRRKQKNRHKGKQQSKGNFQGLLHDQ